MEEQPPISLFGHLSIEEEAKTHLAETARYAKYVGVITLVFAALSLIQFIYKTIRTADIVGSLEYLLSFGGLIGLFIELLGTAIYFAVGVFTIRFANKMKSSIELLNQQDNDEAWHNLKMAYRVCGLLAIISILFILFVLIFAGLNF